MKYIIMCGGIYDTFTLPKQLSIINGERLVERTIRLLKENNINSDDIFISSNDKRFDVCGVSRLIHENSYSYINGKLSGYWLDAFYPNLDINDTVTYLFGDVYYSDNAIKLIINTEVNINTLFGTKIAKNKQHKNWGEPFAYKVINYKEFLDGIKEVKKLQDEGKTKRIALVWELYRYLNNLDINVQAIKDESYICIDDETIDIDAPWQINRLNEKMKEIE